MSKKNSALAETKLIGKSRATLPCESLSQIAITPDLQRVFNNHKSVMALVSRCWKSRISGEDDPLLPMVIAGEMDRVHYQGFWLYTNKLWALWMLVQQCEPFVRRKAYRQKHNYPFTSARELFLHLIESEIEEEFLERLDYKEVSQKKVRDHARLSVKLIEAELPPEEYALWKRLGNNLRKNSQVKKNGVHWRSFCLIVFDERAKTDLLIASELEHLTEALKALYALHYTASRKRYSQTWIPFCSYAWNDGHFIPLSNTAQLNKA